MGCGASTASPPTDANGKPLKRTANDMPEKGRVGSSAQSEEDGAAAKLQAVQRGRKERQQLEVIGQQLDKAATVMQARFRGKKARSHAANLHAEREVVRETSTAGVKRSKVNSTVLAVNDWQFGKVLGKGAYGEVYLATKKGSPDDPVAVKVLSRSILKRKRVGRFGSAYDSVMGEISVMKGWIMTTSSGFTRSSTTRTKTCCSW